MDNKTSLKRLKYLNKTPFSDTTTQYISGALIECSGNKSSGSRAEAGKPMAITINQVVTSERMEEIILLQAIQCFSLSRTAERVLRVIVDHFTKQSMVGGDKESVYISWAGGVCNGIKYGYSEYTFKRGLKEILTKGLLAPKSPHLFWVNRCVFGVDDIQITTHLVATNKPGKRGGDQDRQIDVFDLCS